MTDLIEKPTCFQNTSFFGMDKSVCQTCPWFHVCGTLLGFEFKLDRPEFIRAILRQGHRGSEPEIIAAIVLMYGCSKKAASLAVRYQRKKISRE